MAIELTVAVLGSQAEVYSEALVPYLKHVAQQSPQGSSLKELVERSLDLLYPSRVTSRQQRTA